MKKYIIAITAGLALCLAGCVFASGDSFASPHAKFARSGGVIGVEGGYGFLNTPEESFPKDFTNYDSTGTPQLTESFSTVVNKGAFVWGIHAAYEFLFAKNLLLGVEAGYRNLGESKYRLHYTQTTEAAPHSVQEAIDFSRKIDQHAVNLLLTSHFYVWKGLNLFGKVGVAYVGSTLDTDVQTIRNPGSPFAERQPYDGKETIWRFRPEFAIGLGYLFAKNVNVYVMFDHIGGSSRDNNDWAEFTDQYAPADPALKALTIFSSAQVYDSNEGVFGIEYKF